LKRLQTMHPAGRPSSGGPDMPAVIEAGAPALTWNDALSVGDERVDTEHRHLIDLINRLHEAVARGFETRVVETVLTDLAAFSRYHFIREERIMGEHQYPDLSAHREEHAALLVELDEMVAAYRATPTTLDDAALARVRTWFLDHLDGADARFAAFLEQQREQEPTHSDNR